MIMLLAVVTMKMMRTRHRMTNQQHHENEIGETRHNNLQQAEETSQSPMNS